jgi:hypothetical protein
MANRKISDLTALTATATGDLLPIVDISEAGAVDQNKKITVQNLFQAIPVDVGVGEGSSGAGINIKNRLAALPTTGTNANIAWLESTSGFAAGSLLLGSRPSTGSVVLSANGAANLVVVPSTGNVGIETTLPTSTLQVGPGNTSPNTARAIFNTNDVAGRAGVAISNWTGAATTNGPRITFDNSTRGVFEIGGGNGTHSFVIRDEQASSDRFTIASDGRVTIGSSIAGSPIAVIDNSSNTSGTQVLGLLNRANANNTSSYYLVCQEPNVANRCFIYGNGNLANANNSYGAISDVKLKENIADAASQWGDVKALQVRNYNFKEETGQQTHRQIGLVAQEAEQVSPGLVYESPDRDADGNDLGTVTKSVNYSVLYMKAVKALQEAMERIETLEARLTAAGIA